MRRDPPEVVKLHLRAEVGFGCPVNGCRLPFLEFHHFDPPWNERNHHDPDGMIALCGDHHKKADREVFSKKELRAFKRSPTSAEEVRGKFLWAGPRQLVRIGGFYVNPGPGLVAEYPGLPRETLDIDSGPEGLLQVSFELRDVKNQPLVTMVRNMVAVNPGVLEDLVVNASGTKLKAQARGTGRGRDEVLQIESSRLSLENLDALLEEDWRRYRAFVKKAEKQSPTFRAWNLVTDPRYPAGHRMIDAGGVGMQAERTPSDESADAYREVVFSTIRRFARSDYFDRDDGIPLLNIRKFKTNSAKGPISVDETVDISGSGHGFGVRLKVREDQLGG